MEKKARRKSFFSTSAPGSGPPLYFDPTRTAYNPEPDFARPVFELSHEMHKRILDRLRVLYPELPAQVTMAEVTRILRVFLAYKPYDLIERDRDFNPANRFTERDIILITYGDLLYRRNLSPLKTLGEFCHAYLKGTINTIHILPFFPSSSDRGFSIVDFETVDPLPHLHNNTLQSR